MTDLERAVDHLYGVDLGEFVAERTALARALREEGRRAEAAQVAELRKPTLPAWVVNQLVRRKRKNVDRLLDAGRRLEDAQKALLEGGERAAFREARERQQDAQSRLRDAAVTLLGQRASDAMLERVAATLGAAAVTADGRAQVAEGQLTAEIEPPGFEAFAGTAASPRPAGKRRSGGDEAKARQEAKAAARESLKAAREREASLAKDLREAEQTVKEARAALDAAERDAERAEAEAAAAAEAVEAARRALEAAQA